MNHNAIGERLNRLICFSIKYTSHFFTRNIPFRIRYYRLPLGNGGQIVSFNHQKEFAVSNDNYMISK